MQNTYFFSDSHFGHKKIITFPSTAAYRPFATIEEHDEELIRRWNSVIKPKDTVWHLGDFCFGRENIAIAGRLNGLKRLVLGNHDSYPVGEYLKYFHSVHGVGEYSRHLTGSRFVLTHVPIHPDSLEERWTYNIHGHLHTSRVQRDGKPDQRYICVSAEQIDLTPISYDALMARENI